jgi:methyl-branched lipid omega-hydroxylase
MTDSPLATPSFWRQPLQERMAQLAEIREQGPFVPVEFDNPLTQARERFYAVTRYDEVVEISRRPKDFCSGQGAVSIPDMPAEALEFFGSFINMDDPRHARQRGIVARSFTPRQLQGVLDSVETICAEVIDGFCERGEADLVEVLSQPFPLLVICDMMGIPRSEFDTVLRATNVILGGGDPEYVGDGDLFTKLLEAGMELVGLMNELAEERRKNPTDDLTSKLVFNDLREDMLAPEEIGPFFILLAVAGNDTTRTAISHGMHLLSQNPDQRRFWQEDLEAVTPSAVEVIVRWRRRSRSCAARSPATSRCRARTWRRATRWCCSTAPPTETPASSTTPSASTCAGTRTPTWASAAPALTSASAPIWPVARCRSCSASSSPACPTSR